MINQNHNGIGNNIYVGGNYYETIQKYPSLLAQIINKLGERLSTDSHDENNEFENFDIKEKIEYNNIVRYREILEENKVFQGKLNSIYKEIESNGSPKKFIILRNIRNLYLKIKGTYKVDGIDEINIIRQNADNIIDKIQKELIEEIKQSSDIKESIEVIKLGIDIIIVDAFMRCNILEEPK